MNHKIEAIVFLILTIWFSVQFFLQKDMDTIILFGGFAIVSLISFMNSLSLILVKSQEDATQKHVARSKRNE